MKTVKTSEMADLLFAIESALPFVESYVESRTCSGSGSPAALKAILSDYDWNVTRWHWIPCPVGRHPVGTRIRFLKTMWVPGPDNDPDIIFAEKAELGRITGHNLTEGYWVTADAHGILPFGASPADFEVVIVDQQPNQPKT